MFLYQQKLRNSLYFPHTKNYSAAFLVFDLLLLNQECQFIPSFFNIITNITVVKIINPFCSLAPPKSSIVKRYVRVYLYAWTSRFIIEQSHPSEGITDSTVVSTLGFYFLIFLSLSFVETCISLGISTPSSTLVTHNIPF